ncbi:MAG TPA: ABC transporter permease [Acidimicrobiales bacterium]|nr:ABC transporter permease [Acidimicrobiales bacterium]
MKRRSWLPQSTALTWVGVVLLGAYVLIATVGRLHGDPTALVADGALAPSWAHPFGTDSLGRDLLARTAEGAWTSMVISVSAVVLSCLVAVPLGLLAAVRAGRWTDAFVMRIIETTQVVPPFILVLLLLGLTGSRPMEVGPVTVSVNVRIAVCLAIGFVPFFARVTRSAALAELQEPYVEELRRLGVGPREVIGGEVFPNVLPTLAVQALLALAIVVFAEGGLSFLGLGVPPPAPTLGNLIAEAGSQLLGSSWWYALVPGLVLVAGITGLNLLSDAVADHLLGQGPLPPEPLDPAEDDADADLEAAADPPAAAATLPPAPTAARTTP